MEFEKSIASAAPEHRPTLRRLADWAKELEGEGLVRLVSYRGQRGEVTLLPRLQPENVGLVTIWNYNVPSMTVFRSVFERRAPQAIAEIETLIAPLKIGQGNVVYDIGDDLLAAPTRAYRIAAGIQAA